MGVEIWEGKRWFDLGDCSSLFEMVVDEVVACEFTACLSGRNEDVGAKLFEIYPSELNNSCCSGYSAELRLQRVWRDHLS
jgi:hypothetical protein